MLCLLLCFSLTCLRLYLVVPEIVKGECALAQNPPNSLKCFIKNTNSSSETAQSSAGLLFHTPGRIISFNF